MEPSTYDYVVMQLKANPGTVWISPSGKTMLMLVGPEEKVMYASALTKNFNDMSQEEIEEAIKNLLSA